MQLHYSSRPFGINHYLQRHKSVKMCFKKFKVTIYRIILRNIINYISGAVYQCYSIYSKTKHGECHKIHNYPMSSGNEYQSLDNRCYISVIQMPDILW